MGGWVYGGGIVRFGEVYMSHLLPVRSSTLRVDDLRAQRPPKSPKKGRPHSYLSGSCQNVTTGHPWGLSAEQRLALCRAIFEEALRYLGAGRAFYNPPALAIWAG
jgi:hypothetical protein